MSKLPSLADCEWLNAPPLRRIFAVLQEAGGEVRVNGGAVRNSLLGEPVADIDLSTTLRPERVMEASIAAGLKVVPTGLLHGTVTVVCEHQPFEVTTLRIDEETYGRKAKVAFTDDWAADAERRDFTINALYCSQSGEVLDLVDGYADILKRRIRFVGLPSRRIKEDFLRILRFFRFYARYGNGQPDADGLAACRRLRKGLDGLARERVRQEFLKLIVAPRAEATLRIMHKERILEHIVPGEPDLRGVGRMVRIDLAQGLSADAFLRLVVLTRNGDALSDLFRLTNEEADRRIILLDAILPLPALREWERRRVLYKLGARAWTDAVRYAWASSRAGVNDQTWAELLYLPKHWPPPRFPVSGKDLVQAGFAPGPKIGLILMQLEDWWIASDFLPDKQAILYRLRLVEAS